MTFENGFLRVKSPITTDGVMLAYDANKQPMFKETHLPLSALKDMERQNRKRAPHLKHIIEVVNPQPVHRPLPTDSEVISKAELAELRALAAKAKPAVPEKLKPKENATT